MVVRYWPMLSKKGFLAGELDFSAPPVHPTRANEGTPSNHNKATTELRTRSAEACGSRQPKTDIGEIWRAAQFSTFRQHRPEAAAKPNSAVPTGLAAVILPPIPPRAAPQ